jgi:hypothetical protein
MAGRPLRDEKKSVREPQLSASVGRIVELDDRGRVLVEHAHAEEPVVARVASRVGAARIRRAAAEGHEVLLAFDPADPESPILIDVVEPQPLTTDAEDGVIEADVDGRRVKITARDEVVIACGEASITLRKNGKVIVRGTHVETYSKGMNRIKGTRVKIN